MNLHVGNLPYKISESEQQGLISLFGEITSAKIIKDTYTGQSNGFGFVEMPDNTEGQTAIKGLNGKPVQERVLIVNEARPPEMRPGGRNSRR